MANSALGRNVTVAGVDQLRAQFKANAWSGRLEGGYRFVSPWIGGIGVTPYAAGQFTTFDLPAYSEQAITGSNVFARIPPAQLSITHIFSSQSGAQCDVGEAG